MNPSTLSVVALGTSSVALALSLGVLLQRGGGEGADPRPPAVVPPGSAELDGELDRIRADLEALASDVALSMSTRSAVDSDSSGKDHGILLERFESLDGRLTKLEDSSVGLAGMPGDDPRSALPMLSGIFEARESRGSVSTEDAKTAALDLRADEEERLDGLRALRGRRLEDGSDARDDDVVLAMVDLAETSEDPEVRADVYRQMSGCTNPHLRAPLLRALDQDANAEVREEAAETLEDFLPDAEVLAALQRALASDPSPRVKAQAAESMFGGKK